MVAIKEAPMVSVDPELSARVRIRRWVRTQMDTALNNDGEVRLPEIASGAATAMLSDTSFVAGPITDLVRLMAYEEASRYVQTTHRGVIGMGDEAVTKEAFAERVKQSSFVNWVEHSGDRNLRLMDMDADDCKAAADVRFQRARTETARGRLLMALAKSLKDGERVGDKFTPEEIASQYAAIVAKLKA